MPQRPFLWQRAELTTAMAFRYFADEKVDVVINAPSITDPQRAQIEDIVKRKAEVGADQIIITLLNMDE